MQVVYCFLSRLKESIRDELSMSIIWAFFKAINLALKAEAKLSRHTSRQTSSRKSFLEFFLEKLLHFLTLSGHNQNKQPYKPKSSNVPPRNLVKASVQPINQALNPFVKPIPGKCYKCNQPSHKFNDCPHRKLANVATVICEGKDVDEFVDLDDFDGQKIVEEGDEGERVNYVVQ